MKFAIDNFKIFFFASKLLDHINVKVSKIEETVLNIKNPYSNSFKSKKGIIMKRGA